MRGEPRDDTMALNPNNTNRWFRPGPDFPAQIEEHRGMEGDECDYVPCDYRTPDYSVLDRSQLSYYLHWRSELARGNCLRADHGYAWLRMCEIADERTGEKGMAELELMYANSLIAGISPSEVGEIMFDYALENDLDLPRRWFFQQSLMSRMVMSEIMESPTEWVPWEIVRGIAGDARTGSRSGMRPRCCACPCR